jgi:hypothetical protein
MSIVKRKNAKGGVYYFNTTTSKFASEAAYKKSKSAPIAKFKARKGKPSEGTCSIFGRELKVQKTSSAGRGLRKCR